MELYSNYGAGTMEEEERGGGVWKGKKKEICAIIQLETISGAEQDDLRGIYLSPNRRRATRSSPMTQSVTRCDSYATRSALAALLFSERAGPL